MWPLDYPIYIELERNYPDLFKDFNGRLGYEEIANDLILTVEVFPGDKLDVDELIKLKEVWVPMGKIDHPVKSSYKVKIVPAPAKAERITTHFIMPGQ